MQISGYNKVTFTPDKSLAEAVNQPFAQFETVILDDAVTDEKLIHDIRSIEIRQLNASRSVAYEERYGGLFLKTLLNGSACDSAEEGNLLTLFALVYTAYIRPVVITARKIGDTI